MTASAILKKQYAGTCEEGLFNAIDTWDEDELIACYRRNPAHSLSLDIPSVDLMKKCFNLVRAERKGIHVCKEFKGESLEWGADKPHAGIHILNRCKGVINATNGEVLKLFVSNGCELEIITDGGSNVTVEVFGYSKVHANCKRNSTFNAIVYQQSKCLIKGLKSVVKITYKKNGNVTDL